MTNYHVGGTRTRSLLLALIVVTGVIGLPLATTGQTDSYTPPRTADGRPDLQGIWGSNSITPLERPDSLGNKATLTAEELARVEATANTLFAQDAGDAAFGDQVFNVALTNPDSFTSSDGGTGNYNQFWLVERDFSNRTSLIIDPPNGKLPPTTLAAKAGARAAEAGRGRPAAWTADRGLSERCVTFELPNLLAGYNSYYQILQTVDHVVIEQELIHTTRIIPLDGRPHVPDDIRQWHGDSRGHWEGDTLVVETKRFSQHSNFRGAREHLQLVERFTRVGPKELNYEFTVTDPTTWTRPWTALVPWKRTDEPMFEYACHEGNIGMEGILAGARAEEAGSGGSR
ncbi:MAG: hypothetical protein QF681_03985 [Vicinamibacterales bacterium]|jgi:hypothetical protein|nr:hypothetical protein [Vicinamibacterales bacterium]